MKISGWGAILSVLLILTGCETFMEQSGWDRTAPASRVHAGMSKAEVMAALGGKVVIGYENTDKGPESFVPVEVPNPYRREKFVKNGKSYEVFYFFTGVKKADGKVTDEELKPYVFEYDLLVGEGWAALERIRGNKR